MSLTLYIILIIAFAIIGSIALTVARPRITKTVDFISGALTINLFRWLFINRGLLNLALMIAAGIFNIFLQKYLEKRRAEK